VKYGHEQKDGPEDIRSEDAEQDLRELLWEHNLPEVLQHDLDAYKAGLESDSCTYLDCLWGELYGGINISLGEITPEHADYLRKKYLFGDDEEE